MFRRIPNVVLWILLAITVTVVPVACIPADEEETDAGRRDSGMTPSLTMTGA